MMNRLIDAVNRSNQTLISLPQGSPAPTIFKVFRQTVGYAIEDYAVRCDAPYVSPGINGYHVLKGAVNKVGLQRHVEQGAYSRAHHIRHFDRNGPIVYVDGYGWIDRSGVQGSDIAVDGVGNTLGFITNGFKQTGVDPITGEPIYTQADYYGTTSPTGDEVILPSYHGTTDPDGRPENWISGGHHVSKGCDSLDAGQFVTYFADFHWVDTGGGSPGKAVGGPGFFAVTPGGGWYTNWPFWEDSSESPWGLNIIGCPFEYVSPTIFSIPHESVINCSGGAAFSFHRLLQRIPAGSTILEAKLEMRVSGLRRRTLSYGYEIVDGQAELIDGEATYTEYRESSGVAVVAGRLVDKTLGTFAWDTIAQAAATPEADKWCVVDATALIQSLIDGYRDSHYCRFAFVPAPYTSALSGITDSLGYLRALLPDVTYACYVSPDNPTNWKDGITGGVPDIDYTENAEAEYIIWDDIQIGKLAIAWRYPDGEYGREVLSIHWPPMS